MHTHYRSNKSSTCSRPLQTSSSEHRSGPPNRMYHLPSLLTQRIDYCVAFESLIDKTKLGNLDRTPGTPWSVAVWQAP